MNRIATLVCALTAISCGPAPESNCPSNTTYSTTHSVGLKDDSLAPAPTGGLRLAQSFLVPGPIGKRILTSISLPLYLGGTSLAGTLSLAIHTDNSGSPSTSAMVSTNTVQLSTVVSAVTLVTFDFVNDPELDAGSRYWLVLNASYAVDDTNIVRWAADDISVNANAYADGQAKYESAATPGTWLTNSIGDGRDLGFQTECQ